MVGRRARHARRKRDARAWAVVLVVAALVAALGGWTLHVLAVQGHVPARVAGLLGGPDRRPASAAVRACALTVARAEDAVGAARPAVDDWSAHVQARTDMLAGRISPAQMQSVWDRTRAAGPGHADRFTTAVHAYGGPDACARLAGASGLSPAEQRTADACVQRARVADEAVTAAEGAVGEWTAHLHHMDTFSDGGMTAGHAQQMWVAAWRKAPAGIDAFEQASDDLDRAPRCDGPG
jgi:hypothetical protein